MSVKKIEELTPDEVAQLHEPLEPWRKRIIAGGLVVTLGGLAFLSGAFGKLGDLLEADAEANVRHGAVQEMIDDGFHVREMRSDYYPDKNTAIAIANVIIKDGCQVNISATADVRIGQVKDTFDYTISGVNGQFDNAEDVRRAVDTAGLCD